MIQAKCPKCNSEDTHRILKQEGLKEFLMLAIRRVPYQCEECLRVFFAIRPAGKPSAG